MSEDLRIRLEGALELIEADLAVLDQLLALADRPLKPLPSELQALAARWQEAEKRVAEAHPRIARVPEGPQCLERISAAATRLLDVLRAAFPHTAMERAADLPQALEVWQRLRRPADLLAPGPVLCEVEAGRSREWAIAAAAAVLLLVLKSPEGAAVCAALALVWRVVSAPSHYCLTAQSLLVQVPDEEPLEVPVDSIEPLTPGAERLIKGLWHVQLPSDAAVLPLIAALKTLERERAALREEAAAVEALPAGEAPLWCAASRRHHRTPPAPVAPPGAVPVVRFDHPVPRVESGRAMVAPQGVLFCPNGVEQQLRAAVLGTPALVVFRDRQVALESLPAAALLEHLDALRAVPGVVWAERGGAGQSWEATAQGEVLRAPDLQLTLHLDEQQREHLHRLRG